MKKVNHQSSVLRPIIYLAFAMFPCIQIRSFAQENISTYIMPERNADKNVAEIYELWKNYLSSNPDSVYNNPYWNNQEKAELKSFDLMNSTGFLSPSLYALVKGYNNLVLEIRNEGDYYVIRSMFYLPQQKDVDVLAITNYVAKKDDSEKFKLYNWLPFYTANWRHYSLSDIEYYYYPEFPFNRADAEKANNMIKMLRNKFGAKIEGKVKQYIARNCDEQKHMQGFDYVIGMGNNICNTCGSTDTQNNIIYGDAVKGAFYQHELSRLINRSFQNAHSFFINGLAEYFNTTKTQLGLTHRQHFNNINAYLEKHPETDVLNLDDGSFYAMDNQTPPLYYIGMIVCQRCLERGGIELLKEGLNTDADKFETFFERKAGIKKSEFNKWVKSQVKKYSKEDMKNLLDM